MDKPPRFKRVAIVLVLIFGAILAASRISSLNHVDGNTGALPSHSTPAGNPAGVAEETPETLLPTKGSELSLGDQFPLLESESTSPAIRGLIAHGSRTIHEVALTFDACEVETSGYDARVIEELVQAHAPATLFLGGKWMLDHKAATHDLAMVPFLELANHSYDHPHFGRLGDSQVRDQVTTTQNILFDLTGRRGLLFRFPYGESSPAAISEVNSLGLRIVQWDVVSGDPSPEQTAPLLIATVLRQVQNGSIVVMHMNGLGRHTAEALPSIISGLRTRGFSLVTVSHLLSDSQMAGETPGGHGRTSDRENQNESLVGGE